MAEQRCILYLKIEQNIHHLEIDSRGAYNTIM